MEFEQFKKRVGLKIKYYRNLNDYTQMALANKINCDDNYLSLIENGHKNISIKKIYEISNALNISASKIFDIEE